MSVFINILKWVRRIISLVIKKPNRSSESLNKTIEEKSNKIGSDDTGKSEEELYEELRGGPQNGGTQ